MRCVEASRPGSVGFASCVGDVLLVLASWGACIDCPADLDGNGTVNVTDLLIVLDNWN